MSLPRSTEVDVATLSRLFSNTTNSYKYIFFLALLDAVEGQPAGAAVAVPHRDLALGMIERAWFPYWQFRLSFGAQDQIAETLGRLTALQGEVGAALTPSSRDLLRTALRREGWASAKGLLRYVPARLLQPFFADELRGLRDAAVNGRIAQLATAQFDARRPLYRLEFDRIVLHPAWTAYLRKNGAIVSGWARWAWLDYMQARNPNVPAVSTKLFPPLEREALTAQRAYWRAVLEATQLRCLYSNELLHADGFDLDHYLPWSYVAHDRLWNLVPVVKAANSAKGDSFPADAYLPALIEVHVAGLQAHEVALRRGGRSSVKQLTESYSVDLKISTEHLTGSGLVQAADEAYRAVIPHQVALAARQGFRADWRWPR